MSRIRNAGLGIGVALVLVGAPTVVGAQETFTIEARSGVALPTGDLSDIQDAGASVGLGLIYRLSPRLSLRLGGSVDFLSGDDSQGPGSDVPDMDIYHYNLGLGLALLDPSASRWSLDANIGIGASTFDTDDFSVGGVPQQFDETYFTLNGGLRLGYDLSSRINLFVGTDLFLMFTDDADTAIFAAISPEADPNGFDTAVTFPFTAGFAIHF